VALYNAYGIVLGNRRIKDIWTLEYSDPDIEMNVSDTGCEYVNGN